MRATAIFFFARVTRRHGRLRDQEGSRDIGRGHPAHQPEGQRHPPVGAERRVAAGEDQPQPVVREVFGLAVLGVDGYLFRFSLQACSFGPSTTASDGPAGFDTALRK